MLEGAEERDYDVYPAQLRETLLSVQGILKLLLAFLGKKTCLFRD